MNVVSGLMKGRTVYVQFKLQNDTLELTPSHTYSQDLKGTKIHFTYSLLYLITYFLKFTFAFGCFWNVHILSLVLVVLLSTLCHSSFTIILMGKRELVALLLLSSDVL